MLSNWEILFNFVRIILLHESYKIKYVVFKRINKVILKIKDYDLKEKYLRIVKD